MNISGMRFLDSLLGFPSCLLVGGTRQLLSPAKESIKAPKSILVMKFFGMGSILLASPMIRQMKQRFPDASISIVTFEENQELVRRLPLFDEMRFIRNSSLANFAVDTLRFMKEVFAGRYDLLIDLEFFSYYSALFAGLNYKRQSVGFAAIKPVRQWMYDGHISYEGEQHIVDKFSHFLNYLDVQPDSEPQLHPLDTSEQEQQSVATLLESYANKTLVALNVNTGPLAPMRKWPLENYKALIDGLLKDETLHLFLIGGRQDAEFVSRFAKSLPENRFTNVAGKLNLGELFELFKRCSLFIGNDSGPAHIAESAGLSSLVLFGPETSRLYGPRALPSKGLQADHFCSPCLNVYDGKRFACKDNICLKKISVDEVEKHAKRILYGD